MCGGFKPHTNTHTHTCTHTQCKEVCRGTQKTHLRWGRRMAHCALRSASGGAGWPRAHRCTQTGPPPDALAPAPVHSCRGGCGRAPVSACLLRARGLGRGGRQGLQWEQPFGGHDSRVDMPTTVLPTLRMTCKHSRAPLSTERCSHPAAPQQAAAQEACTHRAPVPRTLTFFPVRGHRLFSSSCCPPPPITKSSSCSGSASSAPFAPLGRPLLSVAASKSCSTLLRRMSNLRTRVERAGGLPMLERVCLCGHKTALHVRAHAYLQHTRVPPLSSLTLSAPSHPPLPAPAPPSSRWRWWRPGRRGRCPHRLRR